MSIISELPSQQKKAALSVLVESLDFHKPLLSNSAKLFTQYDDVGQRLQETASAFQSILRKHYRKSFELPPPLPVFRSAEASDQLFHRMEAAVTRGCEALTQNLHAAGLGSIVWHDDESCTFDYPEMHIKRGWTTNTFTHSRQTHDLVKARQNRVEQVKCPALAEAIISELPAFVRPHLRIVTGLEVIKGVDQEGQETELNGFGQFLQGAKETGTAAGNAALSVGKSVGRGAVKAAPYAAAAAAGVGLAVGTAAAVIAAGPAVMGALSAAAIATGLMGVAVVDPALCFGNVVLTGWEE